MTNWKELALELSATVEQLRNEIVDAEDYIAELEMNINILQTENIGLEEEIENLTLPYHKGVERGDRE